MSRKTVPHHFGFAQHLEENQVAKTLVDLISGIFNRAGSCAKKGVHGAMVPWISQGYQQPFGTHGLPTVFSDIQASYFFRVLYTYSLMGVS